MFDCTRFVAHCRRGEPVTFMDVRPEPVGSLIPKLSLSGVEESGQGETGGDSRVVRFLQMAPAIGVTSVLIGIGQPLYGACLGRF